MRTTLTLDPDVAARTRQCSAKMRKTFKEVINSALRLGLDQLQAGPSAKPYKTIPRPMGLRPGYSYDDVSELLAVAEGEETR